MNLRGTNIPSITTKILHQVRCAAFGNCTTLSEPAIFSGGLGDAHFPGLLLSHGRAEPTYGNLGMWPFFFSLSCCDLEVPKRVSVSGLGVACSLAIGDECGE